MIWRLTLITSNFALAKANLKQGGQQGRQKGKWSAIGEGRLRSPTNNKNIHKQGPELNSPQGVCPRTREQLY